MGNSFVAILVDPRHTTASSVARQPVGENREEQPGDSEDQCYQFYN